jgi:hypothetical protein
MRAVARKNSQPRRTQKRTERFSLRATRFEDIHHSSSHRSTNCFKRLCTYDDPALMSAQVRFEVTSNLVRRRDGRLLELCADPLPKARSLKMDSIEVC